MVTGVHAEISLQEKEYETPTLLAGYLDRIGKGKLLMPREERESCRDVPKQETGAPVRGS